MKPESFTDNEGRIYPIVVNLPTMKVVRDKLGLNLTNIGTFGGVLLDELQLCEVVHTLYAANNPGGISIDDYGKAMAGESINSAAKALEAAMMQFLPPSKVDTWRIALQGLRAAQDKIYSDMQLRLDGKPTDTKGA